MSIPSDMKKKQLLTHSWLLLLAMLPLLFRSGLLCENSNVRFGLKFWPLATPHPKLGFWLGFSPMWLVNMIALYPLTVFELFLPWPFSSSMMSCEKPAVFSWRVFAAGMPQRPSRHWGVTPQKAPRPLAPEAASGQKNYDILWPYPISHSSTRF